MNSKERFTELVSTVDMLPPISEWREHDYISKESLIFPDGTDGIDENMAMALIAHASTQSDTWKNSLFTVVHNSIGMHKGNMSHEEGLDIQESDIYAIGVAMHLGWLSGSFEAMAMAFGFLNHILTDVREKSGGSFSFDPPAVMTAFLRSPEELPKAPNPYDLLDYLSK